MLQMASVYGVQQTAKQAPAFVMPHLDEVGHASHAAMYITYIAESSQTSHAALCT